MIHCRLGRGGRPRGALLAEAETGNGREGGGLVGIASKTMSMDAPQVVDQALKDGFCSAQQRW